jgi:pyruvate kinase
MKSQNIEPGSKSSFIKTKIVATIGPACLDSNTLRQMIGSGLSCARLNTAHGDFPQYASMIGNIREAGDIPIMVDIKGPEIRVRMDNDVTVQAGDKILFGFGKGKLPYFSFDFSEHLLPGDIVFFDNGIIESRVAKVMKGDVPQVLLSFSEACIIKPNKGVNLPAKKLKMPSLSEKDREAIKFSIRQKVSFIALSFTRYKEDVLGVRKLLGNAPIGIISKIENEEGLENIDEIIETSDGIMVARGDLGVQIPAQKIPYLQKMIVQKCNSAGKLVIVATQMLETMTNSPTPTRAEVSDVANAVLDGADAVMLSGETAVGKYPVKVVETMKNIALEVEDKLSHVVREDSKPDISEEISRIACELANYAHATKIACITRSGFTARLIARFRPNQQILAITDSKDVMLQLKLVWGVMPLLMKIIPSKAIMPAVADYMSCKGIVSGKDLVVFVGGIRTLHPSVANVVEIHAIDDLLSFRKKYIKG